jgi:branched-subunit amino acid aminotransferase/4-amino-4-deoxychorismate lyase
VLLEFGGDAEAEDRLLTGTVHATGLFVADVLFLCGTAYEIVPVHGIDGYHVGNGGQGR